MAVVALAPAAAQARQLFLDTHTNELGLAFLSVAEFATRTPKPSNTGETIPVGSRVTGYNIVKFVSSTDIHVRLIYTPPSGPDPLIAEIDPPDGESGDVVAYGMNQNLTVVGFENYDPGENAFYWTPDSGIHVIGQGQARAVDADGSVIVGQGNFTIGGNLIGQAFRWTSPLGMVDIDPTTGNSMATGVSDDGTVVAGEFAPALSIQHAFRWNLTDAATGSGTLADLGSLGGATAFSQANGISGDGNVIIGQTALDTNNQGLHAFEAASGDMVPMRDLGTVAGKTFSNATAVDEDGSVIVGSSWNGTTGSYADALNRSIPMDSVATRWTAATGAQDINKLMAGIDLQGLTLLTADSISADGEFIGGGAVPTGSPANTAASGYAVRICDATDAAACDAYDELVAGNGGAGDGGGTGGDGGGGGGVLTTNAAQQSSVDGLGDDRLKVMAGEEGFVAPLIGDNSPILGGSSGGVYASVGSLAGGFNGRYASDGLTLLGGIAVASEGYGGADMSGGLLFAGAARYVEPVTKNLSILAEAGGWFSPSGTYTFTRDYTGGAGVGSTTGSQNYLFARVGPVWNLADGDELALTGELGRQQFDTDAYSEALAGNPFNAVVSAGTDTMGVAKLRGQWTHHFSPALDTTVWGAIAAGFGHTSTATATVAGIGTLTPATSNPVWGEFGVRVGYHVNDQVELEGFTDAVLAGSLGNSVHFGGGLKVSF